MRIIQIGFLFIILICSCCSTKEVNIESINLRDAFKESVSIKTSQLFKTAELIPLESNDSIFIGSIKKILINQKYIVIFDNVANKILLFDRTGNFERILAVHGKGPGEFAHIIDMNFNYDQSEVVIFDDYNRKFISFNLEEISWDEKDVRTQFSKFLIIGMTDTLFACQTLQALTFNSCLLGLLGATNDDNRCLISNDSLSISDKIGFRPIKLYTSSNKIVYWDFIHNVIYKFNRSLVLESAKQITTNGDFIPMNIRAFDKVYFREYNNYNRFMNFTETPEYIYFNGVLKGGLWRPILYNKSKDLGQSIEYDKNFSPGGIDDNILGLTPFWPYSITTDEEPFDILTVVAINEYNLLNHRDTSRMIDYVKPLFKLPPSHNPIIRIYKNNEP